MSKYVFQPPKACPPLQENYYMLSIAGPKYHVKSHSLQIAIHRGFRTKNEALEFHRAYLKAKEQDNVATCTTIGKMNEALVLTKQPKHLSQSHYQDTQLHTIFTQLKADKVKEADLLKKRRQEHRELEQKKLREREKLEELREAKAMTSEGKGNPDGTEPAEETKKPDGPEPVEESKKPDRIETKVAEEKEEKLGILGPAESSKQAIPLTEEEEAKKEKIQDALRTPLSLPSSKHEFALVQFIAEIGGKRLDEPILIPIGFFANMETLNTYAQSYIESPTNMFTQLVPVPLEAWKSPFVQTEKLQSRVYPTNAKFLQQYHDSKKQVKEELGQQVKEYEQKKQKGSIPSLTPTSPPEATVDAVGLPLQNTVVPPGVPVVDEVTRELTADPFAPLVQTTQK